MLTCGQINDLIYLKHEIGNLFIKSLTEKNKLSLKTILGRT